MSGKPFNRNDSHGSQQRYNKNANQTRGNFQQRDQGPRNKFNNYSRPAYQKLQPGSYSKGGKTYLGKREKLKERQNYASKVKSKFAKELNRGFQADGDDAAFAKTPDFYKEIFAEVDRENSLKKSSGSPVKDQPQQNLDEEGSDENQVVRVTKPTASVEAPEEALTPKRVLEPAYFEDKKEHPKGELDKNSHKKSKPNPFKKSIEELEKQQKELEKIKKDAANESARKQNEQKIKKRQRKQITSKLMRRSKTGQPILGNQISIMLSKLEKS
ncbi:hypothetical protein DSO57_1037545 [Entomophthora muscae]|uniref:Uncharacterized protein n=1 Tax=Entomophthora muscae TaxID=34485 RepID=A0ACC2RDN7_9FUNG|nr:hypothetical protein DSO57_1037545 [Entomophthora muscae]